MKIQVFHIFGKNNNCESMNHKIKLLGNWHISKLSDLISRLQVIETSQLLDIRGALHGRGNIQLAPHAIALKISHSSWLDVDEQTRQKMVKRFLRFVKKENETLVTSTDLTLNIPVTSKIAKKKPGQVKRVRSAKTTTVTNKKHKCER